MDDDKIIINKIIAGDINIFSVLIKKYQNPVFRVVLKIVGNHEDAKEVTQDVFVKTYESLDKYNPDYKFFSWLYRIAINGALMYVKKRKKQWSVDQLENSIPDEQDYYQEEISNRIKQMNGVLIKLPEKYKVVILLKYYAEQSYTEIARITGIDEKKVKSRLFDGRKLLKNELIKTDFFS